MRHQAALRSATLDHLVQSATTGENPMQRRIDHALGRVLERHQPFVGAASRQQPSRRTVRVRLPLRLPRPMSAEDIDLQLIRTRGPDEILRRIREAEAEGAGSLPGFDDPDDATVAYCDPAERQRILQ